MGKKRIMSEADIETAHKLYMCGFSISQIAEHYSVCYLTVNNMFKRYPRRETRLTIAEAVKVIQEEFPMPQQHPRKRSHEYQKTAGHYTKPKPEDVKVCKTCKWGNSSGACGYSLVEDHHTRTYLHGSPLKHGKECEEYEPKRKKSAG